MRTSKVLASGLQLFMAILCMIVGGMCIIIPLFPLARSIVVTLFKDHPGLLPLLGYFSLGLGLLLFIAFYAVNRGQYYQVGMHVPIQVDARLLQAYAVRYMQSLFPDEEVPVEVVVHGHQNVELIVEMPDSAPSEHTLLLQKIECELGTLLSKHFGYKKEFLFTCLLKNCK